MQHKNQQNIYKAGSYNTLMYLYTIYQKERLKNNCTVLSILMQYWTASVFLTEINTEDFIQWLRHNFNLMKIPTSHHLECCSWVVWSSECGSPCHSHHTAATSPHGPHCGRTGSTVVETEFFSESTMVINSFLSFTLVFFITYLTSIHHLPP